MSSINIESLPYRDNVGIMLVNEDNRVFVGQRRDNHQEAWQMPQGGIDPGETPETAALRELEEETGVSAERVTIIAVTEDWIAYDLPVELIAKLWSGRYRGQRQKWFLMRFLGTDEHVQIETDHQEFSKWKWLDIDQLEDHIVPFKREVYRQVMAEFAPKILS